MRIGFIGFGNMANAIAGGVLRTKMIAPAEIGVFDVVQTAQEHASALGFTVLHSENEVLQQCEFVFLCVKPQSFTDVLSKIKASVREENIFLTIAAGITISSICNVLGNVPVLRAMPNTPLLLGKGAVALTQNALVREEYKAFVTKIFKSVGTVYELPEDKFNEVINVNGSTPAYIYLFVKTIVDFAEKSGISADIALPMLCDTMLGSAAMLLDSGKTPDELIAMVSSKGGTTVAALETFKKTGFVESLEAGMQACVKRAYEMSL